MHMHVNGIPNFTSKWPMRIATAHCQLQLLATDCLVIPDLIQVVKVNLATVLVVESRNHEVN